MSLAEDIGPAITEDASTLREMLVKSTRLHPNHPALVSMYQNASLLSSDHTSDGDGSLSWTYQQLDDKAEILASSLYTRGLRPGMRIAVFLPNGAEWTLLFWTSVKMGIIFVSLDERAVPKKDEIHHFLDVTRPSAIFVSSDANARSLMDNTALDLGETLVKVVTESTSACAEGWESFADCLTARNASNGIDSTDQGQSNVLQLTNGFHRKLNDRTDNDLSSTIYILFTSGTSGLPKACPLTNKNIWASSVAAKGLYRLSPTDRIMINSPPSHSMGVSSSILAWANGTTAVVPSPAFDAKLTLETIEKMKCTHMAAIPVMLLALFKQPNFHPAKTQSLQWVLLGGTIVSPATFGMAISPELLGASEAVAGFGMTEGLPICGSLPGKELVVHRGAVSLGQALAGVRIRICESEGHEVLRRGETGELHYGGDIVISGYLHGDNTSFYDDDFGHWISTGDEAMMDDEANIFIFGRYKDIIIRGGENLSPGLIENCIGRAMVQGQIVGIPDEIAGEVPLAIVQTSDQGQIPKAEIHNLIMESLGPACLPTAYLTLAELGLTSFPLTTSGKVRKTHLRHLVLEHMSRESTRGQSVYSNGVSVDMSDPVETFLEKAVASLTGLSQQSVHRDQPLSTMLDSINILRLQAQIQRGMSKSIPIDRLLGDTTVRLLASELQDIPTEHSPAVKSYRMQGPPTALDMVHTHDDPRCAARTKAQAEILLSKHGLSWDDVEAIFPFPALSAGSFDVMRPLGFSVRFTFLTKSISASQLRLALESTLEKWSMFRSLAMRFDNIPLFIIVRACSAILQASIFEAPEIKSHDDLGHLRLSKSEDANVHPAGGSPLASFIITRVKSTGTAAMLMLAHHSIFDAISIGAFFRDLEANIHGSPTTELHTSYKLFADTYYLHNQSQTAQNSIAYHVSRFRGIAHLRETAWPAQRTVGTFIGDDTGYSIPPGLRNPLHLQKRTQIDNDGGYAGMLGIQRTLPLSSIPLLHSSHGISTPVFFKAALALLTSHLSHSSEIIFAQSQAGRSWPFLQPHLAAHLPNPVTLAGSTLAVVFNRIHVSPDDTVGAFLSHLEQEQMDLTKHAHAPVSAVLAGLGARDAAALMAGRRHLFNWNPVLGDSATAMEKAELGILK
ncbi:MAG: hypothetical protein Q9204_006713, partial [Flavoplaca sp. TL-2023a]